MAKKWIALNILLLVAAVGLAREMFRQYEQFKTKSDLAVIAPVHVENQASAKSTPGASITDISIEEPDETDTDYFVISEKTLFSEMRGSNNEETVQTPLPKAAPLPNPKPILVGTTLIDGQYAASVIDQASAAVRGGQGNPETWRLGDFYRGYKVTAIDSEQLVLENGGTREVLQLNRAARRTPQTARSSMMAAVNLVSVGPAITSSGALTVSMGSTAVPAVRGAAAQPPQAKAPQGGQAQGGQAKPTRGTQEQAQQGQGQRLTLTSPDGTVISLPENLQNMLQVRQPTAKAKPGGTQPAQGEQQIQTQQQQQELRTVRTPFGEIVR
jgi:hypothetical protein